ncbi:MAG: hypothetical protein JWM26_1984, partial [Betaproteobacteria bacterium]|nr:hypothetical protein [Betaproteobacteria bacterium]
QGGSPEQFEAFIKREASRLQTLIRVGALKRE